jgi:hypothetical protein
MSGAVGVLGDPDVQEPADGRDGAADAERGALRIARGNPQPTGDQASLKSRERRGRDTESPAERVRIDVVPEAGRARVLNLRERAAQSRGAGKRQQHGELDALGGGCRAQRLDPGARRRRARLDPAHRAGDRAKREARREHRRGPTHRGLHSIELITSSAFS